MRKLILIDGNAILHRAFHAYPGFTDKEGNLVNAVYGFSSMFLKILEDQQPDYIVVCFDRPKPTFRKALYVGYQAKRPKMDDTLVPQIVRIHEVLEKMKVTIFEVDGYEADDLIGTLAAQAVSHAELRGSKTPQSNAAGTFDVSQNNAEKIEVIIVTGDRDMLQLVNSHVKVLMPLVGMTTTALYDGARVEEKFGLKPRQFIDYKALVGDASDNYPGVTGIGPKTASDLLRKYETFENLYEHITELPEKIATKLANDAEQAALAKKLATIATDAPITLDLEKCHKERFSEKGAREIFEELGFKSLVKRLKGDTSDATRDTKEKNIPEKKKIEDQQLGLL